VKTDVIKTSVDWLNSNDYEMMQYVFAEVDMVNEIMVFSDKCTLRELQKLDDEFEKDLKKLRYKFRNPIWKFIKDENSKPGEKKEGDNSGAPQQEIHENIASQNPKINYQIAPGFAKQLQNNP